MTNTQNDKREHTAADLNECLCCAASATIA